MNAKSSEEEVREAIEYANSIPEHTLYIAPADFPKAFKALRTLEGAIEVIKPENSSKNAMDKLFYALAHSNKKLIGIVLRRAGIDPIRYYQEAQEAIERTVIKYDLSRGAAFSRLATRKICGRIGRELEKDDRQHSLESKDPNIGKVIKSLKDNRYCNPADLVMQKDLREYLAREINKLISVLTERQREFVERRFGLNGYKHGSTYEQIGEETLPISSKENVREVIGFALNRLREEPIAQRAYLELVT